MPLDEKQGGCNPGGCGMGAKCKQLGWSQPVMGILGLRRWVCEGMLWGVLGIPADLRPDHFSSEAGPSTIASYSTYIIQKRVVLKTFVSPI